MNKKHFSLSPTVRVSVVIPSLDGDRGGNVPLLLDDLRRQSFQDVEVTIAIGVSPQGKAINQAAAEAKGDMLLILDDDTRMHDEEVIAKLVEVLRAHADVGMAGASIVQPEHVNGFQASLARQMPRFSMQVVDEITDSDMPCHGCCLLRRDLFIEIGGEREDLVRGLDPDLRQRIREKGYRVVLAPRVSVTHPVPSEWKSLIRMFFRNGKGSAFAQYHHPDIVYDTDENMAWNGKPLRASFIVRIVRYPLRFLRSLAKGHLLRAVGDVVYVLGFAWGMLRCRTSKV